MSDGATTRSVLRELPLPARLVLAVFLVSVGLGYFSALVQLHFQNATPGRLLPDADDAARIYNGRAGMSQLERVLTSDESQVFNGSGTMRPAFTTRSARWKRTVEARAKEKNFVNKDGSPDLLKAEADVRGERDGERLALVEWIRAGAPAKAFEDDAFPRPASLASHPVTEKYAELDVDGKPTGRVKIKSIVADRCARCHGEGQGGPAAQFPLETVDQVREYCEIETGGGAMSLKKLAQTTHVHLLGFSMLYGLTGLIFTLTNYPWWARVILGPFTLIAQIVDISCWWLGRLDPHLAKVVALTGGMVAAGLFLQIVLSLFNMFGRRGKVVLIVLMVAVAAGVVFLNLSVIGPYLQREGVGGVSPD